MKFLIERIPKKVFAAFNFQGLGLRFSSSISFNSVQFLPFTDFFFENSSLSSIDFIPTTNSRVHVQHCVYRIDRVPYSGHNQ